MPSSDNNPMSNAKSTEAGIDASMRQVLLRLLEASASAENIAEMGRSDLRDCLIRCVDNILIRKLGQPKIDVFVQSERTVVTIVNDDMPFLLDSVLGEINANNFEVALVLHPILEVDRDVTGAIVTIPTFASRNSMNKGNESVIVLVLRSVTSFVASGLEQRLLSVLEDVRFATSDWRRMIAVVSDATTKLSTSSTRVSKSHVEESIALLNWLCAGNFTFLGTRNYTNSAATAALTVPQVEARPGAALGILRRSELMVMRSRGAKQEIALQSGSGDDGSPIITIAKSNILGRVHRRTQLDCIAIPEYAANGLSLGELRIVGLFTSQSYQLPPANVPLIRQKTSAVLAAAGAPEESHDGKAMRHILSTLPRDELFQIDTADLQRWTVAILDLELRPRVRVLFRHDRFGRFVSVLVFASRERWNTVVRERISALLTANWGGRIAAFTPYFTEGPLVRAHFIVTIDAEAVPHYDEYQLETEIAQLCRTWEDDFATNFRTGQQHEREIATAEARLLKFSTAFPPAYRNAVSPSAARIDVEHIEALSSNRPVKFVLSHIGSDRSRVRAAVYRLGEPLRLSERVPLLENLGFSVIDESTYAITPRDADGASNVTLHVMELQTASGNPLPDAADCERLEAAFDRTFRGIVENDTFNQLVMVAGATWREAAVVRAYAGFLRQLNVPFGIRLIADTCIRHAGVSRDLLELFQQRFNPAQQSSSNNDEVKIVSRIEGALANIPTLDEDRILRHLLNLVATTVRTNAFQPNAAASGALTLAFKFDSKSIDASPLPRPFREIWVSGPAVDGVHLRFGPVSRGGLRWSDRAQDFRTEVLGLVRAQVVKNAVIVPTGSKGGFYPKQLPRGGSREAVQSAGVAAYTIFVSSLLDLTDNLDATTVVHPADVVRKDGDDPYLVVAADKGTATFSDTANAIAAKHNFWLDDAFASGGSVGYDHKKMGITARGAWESVKRHFRDMGKNVSVDPFDVVGVGDMSGDVFGNGMLLSPAIRLVAAFDHRDIFLDPSPDATTSLVERQRLFKLPRSSWQDYDKTKISDGGGVYARTLKSIGLSAQVRERLGIDALAVTPDELMRAILKAKSDLLWLGGIGTYVRATTEQNDAVGDRSNDSIRVTGQELGAKVVGEGANLGLTQKGRVEFALAGGQINTDFIDNSAGVNSSDIEVNFKIALQPATKAGTVSLKDRATFLASLTNSVSAACLQNNYRQSLALSFTHRLQFTRPDDVIALVRFLENRGALNRRLESIPDDHTIASRISSGQGLTRPELSILLSFAKLELTEDIVASTIPDLAIAQIFAAQYFPIAMRETFPHGVAQHRLRREIIATALANTMLNRGGAAFVADIMATSGRSASDVARAYLVADSLVDSDHLFAEIDALDDIVVSHKQMELYARVQAALRTATADVLKRQGVDAEIAALIEKLTQHLSALSAMPRTALPQSLVTALESDAQDMRATGAPRPLASKLATLQIVENIAAVTDLAIQSQASTEAAAAAHFKATAMLNLGETSQRAAQIKPNDEFDRQVIEQAVTQLGDLREQYARYLVATGDRDDADTMRRLSIQLQGVASILTSGSTISSSRLLIYATKVRQIVEAHLATETRP